MKKIIRILSFLSVLILLLSTAGVYATWNYIRVDNSPQVNLAIELAIPPPVEWVEKDILPPEHARLVEIFVREINDPTSEIHTRMSDRLAGFLNINLFGQKDKLGSMDEDGAALREIFSCENSHFIVKMNAKANWIWGTIPPRYTNTYYGFDIFTTESDLSTLKAGDWVEGVYKTTFKKDADGKWIADQSYLGRAPFASYDAEWSSETIPAFNVDKWEAVTTS